MNILRPAFFGAIAATAMSIAPAMAHDAPSILQLGTGGAKTNHGAGAHCEMVGGVHLCGATAKKDTALSGDAPQIQHTERLITKRIDVVIDRANQRCLATQRVIPGIGCVRKRRFTQGFFADRVARGL